MQAELKRFEKSIEHLSLSQIKSLYENVSKDPNNIDMNTKKIFILGRRNLLLLKSRSLPYSVTDFPLVKKKQPRLFQSYYVAKPVSNERVKSALALIQESSSCLSISAERPQAPFALRAFRGPIGPMVLQKPLALLQEPLAPLIPCNPTPPEASHAPAPTPPEAPQAPRFLQAEPKVGRFLLRVLQEPIKAATTPQMPPRKPKAVPTTQAPVFSCNSTPPEAAQAQLEPEAAQALLQEPLALLASQALLQEPLALLASQALLQEPLALGAPEAAQAQLEAEAAEPPSASQRFLLFLIFFLLVLAIFWFNAEVSQELGVVPPSRICVIASKNINKNV
jgi:hypothetical protein